MGTVKMLVVLFTYMAVTGCTSSHMQRERAAGSEPPAVSFDYNHHIGWIHGRCFAIKRADVRPGMPVQVISLASPQTTSKTTIIDTAGRGSGCLALLPERARFNQKKGRSFYTLDFQEGTSFMAVGLVEYTGELVRGDEAVRMDINHDGKQETARFCQTSEGITFSLAPVGSSDRKPLWQDYYYLGYDTKPTCKD